LEFTADISDHLGRCIARIGTDQLWQGVHDLVATAVPHQMGAAFVYADQDPPVRIFDSEGNAQRDELHQILANIGYMISPYYNVLIRTGAESGFYQIDQVAPDEFRKSEYFEVYYGRKLVEDEGMFLCRVDENITLVFMVERHKETELFSQDELDALRNLHPVVFSLISRHVALTGLGEIMSPESRANRTAFREVTEKFGTKILSARERDVAMLILRGHSSKSAARILEISPETERVHRRRLYTRLGISSHSELFWLFLQASDYLNPNTGNDPLLDFLRDKKPEVLPRPR